MNKMTTILCGKTSLIFYKKTFFITFLILYSFSLFAQTFDDPDELADAVNEATEGGTFIVENGTYSDFEATFEIMATEANPIIIKAEDIGGVTLNGESHFVFKKSAYITLEGFVFDATGGETLVKLEGCNHIRITRNVFELATTESVKWVLIGGVWNDNTLPFEFPSHNNRIDHNIFQNKTTPGHYITIDGTTDSNDIPYQSQNDRIDHNYFKNNGPRAENEQESIRIGWSEMSMSSGYTVVEYNLFEDCDGDPEIVSVKSCDNIIRRNTFLSSYGTLSLRHGNRNRVEGNHFFGNGKPVGTSPAGADLYTGGIRIYGKDHVIINNYMEGLNGTRWDAPITLTLGDAIDGESTSLSKHFRAENVLIAYNTLVGNTHGIEIGYDNNDNYNKDLEDITIVNNLITGSENGLVEIVDVDNDQGDNITWLNNLMFPTDAASTLIGATTTSFEGNEAINDDPNLVLNPSVTFENTDGVWKATAETPEYDNAVTTEIIDEDIDGHERPDPSNPGADHFSEEMVQYPPITETEVGPYAFEDDEPFESLFLSSLATFPASGGSQDVSVSSNLDWSVNEEVAWISADPTSGSGNGSFTVTVSENPDFTERTASIIVTGGDLTKYINIIQEAAVLTNLINDGTPTDPVTVTASTEQVDGETYFNYATNTLDKDFDTRWSGQGIGAEIIYDLGALYSLDLVNIATLENKTYLYEIWVSTNGTDYTFVSSVESNTTGDYESYPVTNEAQFVKIVGNGQTSGSEWNSITEIEIYGDLISSVYVNEFEKNVLIYPVPVNDELNIKALNGRQFNTVKLFTIEGELVLYQTTDVLLSELNLNLSTYSSGTYLIELSDKKEWSQTGRIIISQ